MFIHPPDLPDTMSEFVRVGIAIPEGHTAFFADVTATYFPADSTGEWAGSVIGSGSARYDAVAKHMVSSEETFSPKSEIRGGTSRGSWARADAKDYYYYKVGSDRGFPEEFSLRLPNVAIDGKTVEIPIVHFHYGKGIALCGFLG
jgi:hypothetical protein